MADVKLHNGVQIPHMRGDSTHDFLPGPGGLGDNILPIARSYVDDIPNNKMIVATRELNAAVGIDRPMYLLLRSSLFAGGVNTHQATTDAGFNTLFGTEPFVYPVDKTGPGYPRVVRDVRVPQVVKTINGVMYDIGYPLYQPGKLPRMSMVLLDWAWNGFWLAEPGAIDRFRADQLPLPWHFHADIRYAPGSKFRFSILTLGPEPPDQQVITEGTYEGIQGLTTANTEVSATLTDENQMPYTERALPGKDYQPIIPTAYFGRGFHNFQTSGPLEGPFYYDP